jgi:hypothetical protein
VRVLWVAVFPEKRVCVPRGGPWYTKKITQTFFFLFLWQKNKKLTKYLEQKSYHQTTSNKQ